MSENPDHIVSSVTVAVELESPAQAVFDVASDHFKLAKWAHPIQEVRLKNGKREVDYLLPDGVVTCSAESKSDPERGTVDWRVDLPKGAPVQVYSRVMPLDAERSVYVFTLLSPPMPRRRLKDAYTIVQKNLLKDLDKLKELVAAESRKDPDARRRERLEAGRKAKAPAPAKKAAGKGRRK